MKHLIIGKGQVGQALYNVFKEKGVDVFIQDIKPEYNDSPNFLHICFPYLESPNFVDEVKIYQAIYKPDITIIHSTVPLGTNIKCNSVSSPIHGIHPNLEEGIKAFTKFIGSEKLEDAEKFQKFWDLIGKSFIADGPKEAEAHKFALTFLYCVSIFAEKAIYEMCQKEGLNLDQVYTRAVKIYNEGYKALGKENVIQPILKHMPGPVGGHCVIPNLKFFDHEFARFLEKLNNKYVDNSS